MLKVALGYRQDYRKDLKVITYSNSFHTAFEDLECEVIPFGQGHTIQEINSEVRRAEIILELDCGRDATGKFNWQVPKHPGLTAKTAVYYIDSHNEDRAREHKELASKYNYVFFAPFIKRDLFAGHRHASWLPNASDCSHFGRDIPNLKLISPQFDYGFHGSKMGLSRADCLKEVCDRLGYTYDIREVVKGGRHRWPSTPEAMRACKYIYNRGQKSDSPNLRCIEAMLVGRTLLTDRDERDGMMSLFKEDKHYIGYDRFTLCDFQDKVKWMMDHPNECQVIADAVYKEAKMKHQIFNRAQTILETIRL